VIKKVKAGYRVVGSNGRNMGTYKTREAAQYRLDTIERLKGER
jgi:hypothetical protein